MYCVYSGGETKPALEENGGSPYIADDQPTSETLQMEPPLSAQYIAGLLEADDLSSDNADIPPPNTTPYSAANLNQRKLLSYATHNQRKPIKNEDKLRLILTCKGKAQAEIAAEFNIMEKTVFEILRDRDEIEEEYISLRRGIRDELLASLNTGAHKPGNAVGRMVLRVLNTGLTSCFYLLYFSLACYVSYILFRNFLYLFPVFSLYFREGKEEKWILGHFCIFWGY